jgi:hypothetical protein
MEDDKTLHISRGVARQWFDSGKTIGVKGMGTYFGKVSYEMSYNCNAGKVTGFVDIEEGFVPDLVIHLRLPDDLKIVSFSGLDNARIIEKGTALEIYNTTGYVHFEIGVN